MRLREFDEKERLKKANEKLTKYKTAAGADATAADAAGDFTRGNKRFKGINRATKKQFDNDSKLAKLKEVAPPGAKAERMVKHIKAGYARDGKLTPKEKGIAFATAWKAHNAGRVEEATGDERFDSMMGQIQREPRIPDSQMPPTDVRDLHAWAVKNHKPYHKIFAEWAMREGFKSVAPALQKAGNLDSDALDYWTPDVWKLWYGPDSEMPRHWSKERVPEELRDYLETVFDAYDRIVFDWPTEYLQISEQGVAEAAQGHTIEAHGVRGMDRRTWHRTFRDADQMMAWAEKHDAEIMGTRDLEQARHHNLSPARQGVTEMDKSEPSAGRDTGPRPGPEREAKPITPKKATKDAEDVLTKAFRDSQRVDPRTGKKMNTKGVAEATDSATSNLIWKAMNYLPHDRPKDMEDILVQIAHNQGPVTRATDDPKKLASLVQAVWMDGQTRKQKVGQQLDELSIDTLRNYMRAQPARIKGPAGLATTNPKKAARIVDPQKGDMRRALTRLKDPEYGQQGMAESNVFTDARMNAIKAGKDTFVVHGKTYQVTGDTTDERQAGLAEDSLAAMRRLAGIVPQLPVIVPNGQRQYRHMPTAVQPR